MNAKSVGGLKFLLRRWVYIPVLFVVFLLSSCYAEALLGLHRVEERLFGENTGFTVLNRSVHEYFLFADSEHYIHIQTADQDDEIRPDFLTFVNESAETEYFVGAFRRQETFSDSSLNSDGDFYLYRGDIVVSGSVCRSHPCAVYWLEDKAHGEIFVSVYSF